MDNTEETQVSFINSYLRPAFIVHLLHARYFTGAGDKWMATTQVWNTKIFQCSEGPSMVTWAARERDKYSSL